MPFEALIVARQAVGAVKPVIDAAKDAELRDQLRRASLSALLNLAEANARKGKDRSNRFRIAEGRAREAMEAVHAAVAWGYVSAEAGREPIELLDRTIAMLVRLRAPRGRIGG